MKIKALFFLCFLFNFTLKAQQVVVLDNDTRLPIAGVTIYNYSKSIIVITDIDGKALLDKFSSSDDLYFQNLLYNTKALKKSEIEANKFKVYLIPNVEGLNEVVISASKFEQSNRDVPQKIISIDANKIQFDNPQTSADLLENSGNVYIQKSQLGGGSPMIRGFSTNRLLITVDGVRMNNAIFRGGNWL